MRDKQPHPEFTLKEAIWRYSDPALREEFDRLGGRTDAFLMIERGDPVNDAKWKCRKIVEQAREKLWEVMAAGDPILTGYYREGEPIRFLCPPDLIRSLKPDPNTGVFGGSALDSTRVIGDGHVFRDVLIYPADGVPADVVDPRPTRQKSKGKSTGAPPKWDWEGAAVHLMAIANRDPDGLPEKQADWENIVRDYFLAMKDEAPGVTTIRDKVRRWRAYVLGDNRFDQDGR